MEFKLQDISLDASEWSYSGEGNMKIVFSYTGNDFKLAGWLLRLDKANNHSSSSEQHKRYENSIFSTHVIGSLTGPSYILPQKFVPVTPLFLTQLNQRCLAVRPAHRVHVLIDLAQQIGVLMPNMLKPGNESAVTVELKPKWGYLPTSSHICAANEVKRRVCRYCMHQYLKHQGKGSEFCPLDLFSTSQDRIVRALDCLAQSPQNNLRVFVDGIIVNTDDSLDTCKIPQWDLLKHVLAQILLQEQFLIKLRQLQKSLDPLDIEGIYPIYQRAVANGKLADCEPSIDDWLQAVEQFRSQTTCPTDKQMVLQFLLSTVLKDISVLIMIKQWPHHYTPGQLPEYRIAIVDTEPKKLSKMPKYLERYQSIVSTYLKHHPHPSSQKQCYE
ncbi:hypothetical protein IWW36_000171 [Coemansia brasiliensis]|uniref:Inositol-pentakisphosphate 2-kinase n=1 Tax=Coemansia brasiliensis TaxID=2650707 RepID=A0A9W8IDY2_9FUNG|nr:hypothetical protein IWW36_000171 [Coemansia brasiliensis]